MRKQYMLFLLIIVLFSLIFFLVGGSMISSKMSKIAAVDQKIKKAQERLNSAKIMNEQLNQFTRIIDNSLTVEKQFKPVEVNAFVKELADLADMHKIAVVSIHPKDVFSDVNVIEQEYTLELTCTYVQVGQFLSELESMDNIIKIGTFEVTPIMEDAKKKESAINTVTHYKVTLELSVLKVVKEA
jgi:Tfp pilus assembly protein PilO